MLLIAVDDRVSAAAVCSGNTENLACANFNPPGSTDDAEQNLVNAGPKGIDRWDLFYPFAPKPLLITVSDKDSFGTYSPNYISSGWEEYGKLMRVYETLGKAGNLAWSDTPLPHGLSYDSRLQVYNWFERHLKNSSVVITEEPKVAPERDEVLRVSKTGNVVTGFGGQTPFSALKARQVNKTPMPLDEIVGSEKPTSRGRLTILSRVPSAEIHIEAVEFESVPGVFLPAWIFTPRKADSAKPLQLMLNHSGRNSYWHEEEVYQQLARRGYTVCAADLRGIGDLTPEFGHGAAGYQSEHQNEENYAWASLMLGKSLLGQRVTDILFLTSGLRSRNQRIAVNANGKLTVPALIATALDPAIESIYLSGGLASFQSVLEAEAYTVPLSNFCMSFLRHTDLPEIAASIAPRRVRIAGAVNGAGARLDGPATKVIHNKFAQSSHWEFSDRADWTFRDLLNG